jgi:glyoxylase-like metal-dependent hydrolase (beta-lactamase superfamily II)
MATSNTLTVQSFFDPQTSTFTYVLADHTSGKAAVIDSVLDFDPRSGRTSRHSVDKVIRFLKQQGLSLEWILETHAHADHLSAADLLREELGGRVAISAEICRVQSTFQQIYNFDEDFSVDGSDFDRLLSDGEQLTLGGSSILFWHIPGHTPADGAFQFDNSLFVGDSLFMPDVGTARCDFPGGSARQLWQSIQRILSLPPETRLYFCHDYPPGENRPISDSCTVAEQLEQNIHVRSGTSESDFIEMRTARDQTLSMPTLILPAIQVNLRAGRLPPAESNGHRYLKIPLNQL